jgi:hypothetical protein
MSKSGKNREIKEGEKQGWRIRATQRKGGKSEEKS